MKIFKKVSLVGALTIGSLLISSMASAGWVGNYPVSVSDTVMSGSIGQAYNSANTTEYLGCSDTGTSATCYGRNSAGLLKTCVTSNAGHLAAIRGAVDSAFMRVYYSGGTCTSLFISNGSYNPDK